MKHEPTHSEGNCNECLIIIYEVMLFLCETFQVLNLGFRQLQAPNFPFS